jgi:hypothetical protein
LLIKTLLESKHLEIASDEMIHLAQLSCSLLQTHEENIVTTLFEISIPIVHFQVQLLIRPKTRHELYHRSRETSGHAPVNGVSAL